jgi:hypothetical protein
MDAHQEQESRIRTAFSEISGLFKEKGMEFAQEDIQTLSGGPNSIPPFPIFIVFFAATKDVLDSLDLTLIGIIFTTLLTFTIGVTIAIWMLGKMKGGFWKKALIKWFWKRFLLAFMIELLPFGKIIPATTILVLMAHYRELKIVKLLNASLEILKKHRVNVST